MVFIVLRKCLLRTLRTLLLTFKRILKNQMLRIKKLNKWLRRSSKNYENLKTFSQSINQLYQTSTKTLKHSPNTINTKTSSQESVHENSKNKKDNGVRMLESNKRKKRPSLRNPNRKRRKMMAYSEKETMRF